MLQVMSQDSQSHFSTTWPFWSQRTSELGHEFSSPVHPDGLPHAHWIATSFNTARYLGWPVDSAHELEWFSRKDASGQVSMLDVMSGQKIWPGTHCVATVYSGHQFGVWAGQLGDGRALLLGEVMTPHGLQELQLKGAGRTPYSRRGDGRAVLRSSVREFLASEAMVGLGIPTTRALCLVGSDLPVRRETWETGAIVTRVAPSFLRFGHFEHFAHHGLHESLKTLADFVIKHFYPECAADAKPYASLLRQISFKTAQLIAQWQAIGFCHGVMNTDNMSILGLTIDYGPFGFMDGFDPQHICNHSDDQGRYAFDQQPDIGWWNLHALAQALMPLIQDVDAAQEALSIYPPTYHQAYLQHMRAKLGLHLPSPEDENLISEWLSLLARHHVDYTLAHRHLGRWQASTKEPDQSSLKDLFLDRVAFDTWTQKYLRRLVLETSSPTERQQGMNAVNPRVVLRNHLAETAIQAANAGDFSEIHRLQLILASPYQEHPSSIVTDDALPPAWAQQLEVSCSS